MSDYYILDGRTPVPSDLAAASALLGDVTKRCVAQTKLPNGVNVSTIFLVLNHSLYERGPPMLFETMIFGGPHDQHQKRYATWAEAERGHAAAVELAGAARPRLRLVYPTDA